MNEIEKILDSFYDWLVKNQQKPTGTPSSYKLAIKYAAETFGITKYEEIFFLNKNLNEELIKRFKGTNKVSYFKKGYFCSGLKKLKDFLLENGIEITNGKTKLVILRNAGLFYIKGVTPGSEKQTIRNFIDFLPDEKKFVVSKTSLTNTRQYVKRLLDSQTNYFFSLNPPAPSTKKIKVTIFKRDPWLANLVKKSAQNCCQKCHKTIGSDLQQNIPELQCHHKVPLAHGGKDVFNNCIALCPNCHRREHIKLGLNETDYFD